MVPDKQLAGERSKRQDNCRKYQRSSVATQRRSDKTVHKQSKQLQVSIELSTYLSIDLLPQYQKDDL
jgi:hypothetical protein